MSTFKLPDLGEGLPDAEIHEWHVNVGDTVETDQPLVSMETAKAVVEVPAPQSGVIATLHGKVGDVIKTGAPLVDFASNESAKTQDSGTVVGKIETTGQTVTESFIIGAKQSSNSRAKATPAVRHLAKQLNVDITALKGTGHQGLITKADVEHAAKPPEPPSGYEALRGPRRTMANVMSQSHAEVVPVTIFEDADIQQLPKDCDITVRIIQAIAVAAQQEKSLNAWYHTPSASRQCHDTVNLGLAIDTGEDLLVPVITACESRSEHELREIVDGYKTAALNRTIAPEQLRDATITLSNFGNFCGRYASPIVVPPMVAILGVGRYRDEPVVHQGKIATHRILPLSLTFDHRAVTGGEATRFLATVIKEIQS